MADLKDPRWMYAKAGLFVLIGGTTFGLLLLPQTLWARLVLQVLLVWSSARAYYFVFYVIEHYVDPGYRFAGLWHALRYLAARKRRQAHGLGPGGPP
jgi:hypothetical protein